MGGHAKVVKYTLNQMEEEFIYFYTDDEEKNQNIKYLGKPTQESFNLFKQKGGKYFIVCIGNNRVRKNLSKLAEDCGLIGFNAIHPSSIIADSVKIGLGNCVFANVVIHPESKIGNHVILNTGVQIDHENDVHDFVSISPSSTTGGNVTMSEGVFLGIGCIIGPGVKIGKWSIIGAGSTVIRDLGSNITAWGSPAKYIRDN